MRKSAIVFLLLLSGCTTKYITRSCLTAEQYADLGKSQPESDRSKLTGKADEDVRVRTATAMRWKSWGLGVYQVLGNCQDGKGQ